MGARALELIGNTTDGRQCVRAVCSVVPSNDGTSEIQILPGGPLVVARDDRMFDTRKIAEAVARSETPMLIDWEHDSESWFGSTRAAGWINSMRVSDGTDGKPAGSVWGTVRWSDEGQKDIDSGAYRYLSPVLMIDPDSREVTEIVSAALTNKPALRMEQVAAFQLSKFRECFSTRHGIAVSAVSDEVPTMNPVLRKQMCKSLGLAETATDEEIAAAISSSVAVSARPSDLHICFRNTGFIVGTSSETAETAMPWRVLKHSRNLES